MNTRIIRLLCITALLSLCLTAGALAAGYPDTGGHWAEEAIDYWTEAGVFSGYPDGTFMPNQNISRAEAAAAIARLLNLSDQRGAAFHDVSASHWASGQIHACASYGLIQGAWGYYRPNDNITRQEAMTILFRASTFPSREESALETVPDGDQVAAWARDAAEALMAEGVVLGQPDGTIHPQDPISRAEFVTMLYRIEEAEGWARDDFAALDALQPVWHFGKITVRPQAVNRQSWLFLPSSADLTQIDLTEGEDEVYEIDSDVQSLTYTVSGDLGTASSFPIDMTALAAPSDDGSYHISVTASHGDQALSYELQIMALRDIPAMFLSSSPEDAGRDYVDAAKGNSVTGSMVMVAADGSVIYDNTLSQIKSRGNSTFLFYPKKPYQIKLDKKSDLLGNGEKLKTWVLLADYADPSMFRDKLCKDLAREMTLPGTPECDWVDLYFDGEYRGVYLLTEKVQVSSTGLDITDLEGAYEDVNPAYGEDAVAVIDQNQYGNEICYVTDLTDPEDISNGYLVELNYQRADEICWFKTSRGWAFNVKAPEFLSRNALDYISSRYQEFEDAVYGKDANGVYGVNPDTGKAFTEYCDLDSLARMYLIYLFSDNQDAYVQSTYFYLEDGKIHAGPIWDSDQTFGISWTEAQSPDDALPWTYLTEALVEIPAFQSAVQAIYQEEFRDLALRFANETVPGYENLLAGSEKGNHVLWPEYYILSGMGEAYPAGTGYETIVSDTAQWMRDRVVYMDGVLSGWQN